MPCRTRTVSRSFHLRTGSRYGRKTLQRESCEIWKQRLCSVRARRRSAAQHPGQVAKSPPPANPRTRHSSLSLQPAHRRNRIAVTSPPASFRTGSHRTLYFTNLSDSISQQEQDQQPTDRQTETRLTTTTCGFAIPSYDGPIDPELDPNRPGPTRQKPNIVRQSILHRVRHGLSDRVLLPLARSDLIQETAQRRA